VYGVSSVEYGVSVEYGGCYEAVVALCTKRTIDKEKRLPKDRSPVNHTYSLYTTGLGLTTHELTEISDLGNLYVVMRISKTATICIDIALKH